MPSGCSDTKFWEDIEFRVVGAGWQMIDSVDAQGLDERQQPDVARQPSLAISDEPSVWSRHSNRRNGYRSNIGPVRSSPPH